MQGMPFRKTHASKFKDLKNKKFGMLKVLDFSHIAKSKNRCAYWNCICDCGNKNIVRGTALLAGKAKSCGCNPYKKHGMSKTRIYIIWKNIIQRCTNNKNNCFKHYGGRGITLCQEWFLFDDFLKWALVNGYKNNLTIDRIDNNGNYEPNNCRWATKSIQAINKNPWGKSKFKGVRIHKNGKFESRITIGKKTLNLGLFKNEIEAAKKYDEFAIKYGRGFSNINFPECHAKEHEAQALKS